jgi:hypothetical protein
MSRLRTAVLIVLVALPGFGIAESTLAQTSEQVGNGNLNCENFRSVAQGGGTDLDRFFAAFPDDPYDLDRGVSRVPCEDRTELGTGDLASCLSFRPASEGGLDHARTLFEIAGPDDPYNLDTNNDGRACFIETAQDAPDPSPSRPSTSGCVIVAEVAHASACAGGAAEIGLDADEDSEVPVARSYGISTEGLLSTFTQRTAEQGARLVESEQQAERKAKKRQLRKTQRLKQRQLERHR